MHNSKASLLIVDDESSIRTSLSLILTEVGYRVRTAADGLSALAEINQGIPEILVSDLNMSGMTGFELLIVVRRRFPAIRTIAMSGAFSGNEVPSGVAADAFYQKGSSLGSLLMIIEALPKTERSALHPCRSAAPLGVRSYGNDSCGDPPFTITCPKCRRTYPLALDGLGGVKREVNCVDCAGSIQFTIVDPSGQTMPLAFQRNALAVDPVQNSATTSK
jgi:CheY-like chemotaxis protein